MAPAIEAFYRGKRALVTGHTGFKGGWLTAWLKLLGAQVVGYSLPPPQDQPSLFDLAAVGDGMISEFGDIRDLPALLQVFQRHRPEVVFHLAAQALVLRSYRDPIETYATNVMGTAHLLEAVRRMGGPCVVVNVTSDKCYRNEEGAGAHSEQDPMGGRDPYSSSKGCAELVTDAYRSAFFATAAEQSGRLALASARAGNVIGGGDWAEDRIVPDSIRALSAGQPIPVRNPHALRPWQFVLEPLAGYLLLAMRLWEDPSCFAEGWNFGPHAEGTLSVQEVVEILLKAWESGSWRDVSSQQPSALAEAASLRLDASKAERLLGWAPAYKLRDTIVETVQWYRCHRDDPGRLPALTNEQIRAYASAAGLAGSPATRG